MIQATPYFERFATYFARPVGQHAAHTLADGCEIELRIAGSDGVVTETFSFTRKNKLNLLQPSPAQEPQIIFTLTPDAAESILSNPTEDIGQIGIGILKCVFSSDANKRVHFKFKVGFLSLFSKGYLGIIATGGTAFSSALAEKGLNGMGAIKKVLQNLKK